MFRAVFLLAYLGADGTSGENRSLISLGDFTFLHIETFLIYIHEPMGPFALYLWNPEGCVSRHSDWSGRCFSFHFQ